MPQQESIDIELHGIAQGGDGVGRVDGRVVFVAGGLPGELVRARIGPGRDAWTRATLESVLRAAPERCASFCPLEASCSAAGWRWIDQAAQRRWKAAILGDQLRHLAGLDVDVATPVPPCESPELGFRTAADLHVAGDAIGYYLPATRRVADVPACCLHHPLINRALAALRPLLAGSAALRNAGLRCSPETGEVLAVLDGRGALPELARRWRAACPELVGVADVRGRPLAGTPSIERRIFNQRFRVAASSFWQTNALRVPGLVTRVGELLEPRAGDRLLDLYCGAGLFTLTLADRVSEVAGVEEWEPAVRDARANARLNAVPNARFIAGPVERVLPRLEGRWELAVLDPPRRGCAPEALLALAERQPRRIVYVSCHPGTLARDCKVLGEHGYGVGHAETVDMFPHTHHVEAIVVLELRNERRK